MQQSTRYMATRVLIVPILLIVAACTESSSSAGIQQAPGSLVAGEVMALAYSGYREGQHPDQGAGAVNPSREEILEDLQILVNHDVRLIRLYDTGEISVTTLGLIREHGLPIKVLLGIWLRAEISNHEGCPWLDEPIPDHELAANKLQNLAEIQRGIDLASEFDDIVAAVNVGNEALVNWSDHQVPVKLQPGIVATINVTVVAAE